MDDDAAFGLGGDVHWIQARKAFEDRENLEPARLVAVEGHLVEVRRKDGGTRKFRARRAPRMKEVLAARIEQGADGVPALLSERWRVLALILVPPGAKEPEVIQLTGVFRLEGGAAVESVAEEPFPEMALFSIRRAEEGEEDPFESGRDA